MTLLIDVGRRVRAARARLGWTQRELAERAGMSVRFLGQLESGRANVSVVRLAEVADALEVPLARLVSDPPGKRKVALVGLRGAGKSTVGAQAAARLGWPFVELDARVQRRSGMSLSDIFEMHGTLGYHRLCAEALESLLATPEPAVLEIGGSVVADSRAWALLESSSEVVWLRASPESHLTRVAEQGDTRPMQGFSDALLQLRSLLASREPLYRRAGITVDTEQGLHGAVDSVVAVGRRLGTPV